MATIWDVANKDASIVLGHGATMAGKNASAGSWKSVRATTSFSSGKKYLEFYINSSNNDGGVIVGFGNSSVNLATFVGADTNSLAFQPIATAGNTLVFVNNSVLATLFNTPNPFGYVVGCAIDLTNKLVWFRYDRNLNWNNNGANDPATGVGGISYALTGALFPCFSALDGVEKGCATLNAGAYAFSLAAPSGFSAWDTGLPSPNGKVGTTPTTWNPSDKDANVTLSGGNKVATQSTQANVYDGVRSTTSWGSTKVYIETTVTTLGTGNNKRGWIAGFGTSSALLSSAAGVPGADVKSVGYQMGDLNDIIYNTATWGTYNGSQTQGDVYGVAVDFNKGLWWVKNVTTNSNWNASASGDPVAGVFGFGLPTTQDLFVMWGGAFASSTTDAVTANFGPVSFTGTVPTGFSPWDGTVGVLDSVAQEVLVSGVAKATIDVVVQEILVSGVGKFTTDAFVQELLVTTITPTGGSKKIPRGLLIR